MKCNSDNQILILTLSLTITLETNPNLYLTLTLTNPVTPYFIRPLVNKLAKGRRSVAGFVDGALPGLELFLRQFLRMFII